MWNYEDDDENKKFSINDLRICDWQHTIRHESTSKFKVSEKVFLKSNPEVVLVVYSINSSHITTMNYLCDNSIQFCTFPPECLLQYEYAGLMTFKYKYDISFN